MRLYLIARIMASRDVVEKYRILDLDTEEVRDVSEEQLVNAVKNNTASFENIKARKDEGGEYIVIKGGDYEVPMLDLRGNHLGNFESKLYIMIFINEKTNSVLLAKFNGTLTVMDLTSIYSMSDQIGGVPEKYKYKTNKKARVTIQISKGLKDKTAKSYEEFLLKTRLLGMNCSFDYKASSDSIILSKYTGSSTRMIVPNFITEIGTKAFFNKHLTELSLNMGIKHIREQAFAFNSLSFVEIPISVLSIGNFAFQSNDSLVRNAYHDGKAITELDDAKFIVHNKNTKIAKQLNCDR